MQKITKRKGRGHWHTHTHNATTRAFVRLPERARVSRDLGCDLLAEDAEASGAVLAEGGWGGGQQVSAAGMRCGCFEGRMLDTRDERCN